MIRLQVQELKKQFVTEAETLDVLDGINLSVSAGENLAIVGASGSGKSTLLYILGTLDTPTSGKVEIDGVNPFTLNGNRLAAFRNKSIGFVFQDHHLLPQLSVFENVMLPALAGGTPSSDMVARALELIEKVGLGGRIQHVPGRLSGGERQRVAVARALLFQPKLLLADEPTGNLDGATAERITDLLLDLPAREGAALVVVTHSESLARRANRCCKLTDHRLVEQSQTP